MYQRHHRRGTRTLLVLAAVALIYGGLFHVLHISTGSRLIDGSIGVLLGLYICSRPAGNAVDLLFYERGAFHRITSGWAGITWLVLNLVVLFLGWTVIVAGATRFAGR